MSARSLRLTIVVQAVVLLSSIATAMGQSHDYYIIDRSQINQVSYYNSIVDLGSFNPDGSTPPPQSLNQALANILAYQVRNNHFTPTIAAGGIGIRRTLDFSNLLLVDSFGGGDIKRYDGVTLTNMAHLGGFDHFNFVQDLTYLPPSDYFTVNNTKTGSSIVDLPILDPVLDSANNQYYIHSSDLDVYQKIGLPGVTDSNESYYNDSSAMNAPGNFISLANHIINQDNGHLNYVSSLTFEDSAGLSSDFIDPSDSSSFLGFTTKLAGVNADGSIAKTWDGIGTNMNWDTNLVVDEDENVIGGMVQGFSYLSNPIGSISTSGGSVLDVRIDTNAVPEPSSISLLGLAVLILGIASQSRRIPMSRSLPSSSLHRQRVD